MNGWYPMGESQSNDMAGVAFFVLILFPIVGAVLCLAAIILNTGGL